MIGLPTLFRKDYRFDSGEYENGSPLEEPKGFGLLMKPTRKAFLDFAQVLDKLISENLNNKFFAAQGIHLDEEVTQNGEVRTITKGTLRLLEEWLTKRIRIYTENGPSMLLEPLKLVRKLRQSPAHNLFNDDFSLEYQTKKENLIREVYMSISNIRMLVQTHPSAKGYEFPSNIKRENIVIF